MSLDWVAKIISTVTGKSLSDYCDDNILSPLELKDLAYKIQLHDRTRLVGQHQRLADGTLTLKPYLPNTQYALDNPGVGGLSAWSTALDYLKFLSIFLNQGKGWNGARILSPESITEMLRNQIEHVHTPLHSRFRSSNPFMSYDVTFDPRVKLGWGLAFMLTLDSIPTGRSPGSGTWAGLGNCYYAVDPTRGIASIIMCQNLPFYDTHVLKPWAKAETAVYDALASKDDISAIWNTKFSVLLTCREALRGLP